MNEQNPQAKGFYEHLGFKVYKRNPIDEQGNQYPILFMHLLIIKNLTFEQWDFFNTCKEIRIEGYVIME